jgi:hypothetical protein
MSVKGAKMVGMVRRPMPPPKQIEIPKKGKGKKYNRAREKKVWEAINQVMRGKNIAQTAKGLLE